MISKISTADIARVFRHVLPADRVIDDLDQRRIAASDIAFAAENIPACILMPNSEGEVAALVRAARAEEIALHPRGGGWSYTAAHIPQSPRSAIVDTSRLGGVLWPENDSVEVGAGVTWSSLDDELKVRGRRVPSFGPLSGIGAQIGATTANDGAFFGGAGYGAVGENSISAVTLIDGCGEQRRLTEADRYDPVLAPQPLAGDCGAFGIKTAVVLKLIERPETTLFASFAFQNGEPLTHAMAQLHGLPGLGEVYAFNEGVHQNLIASGFSVLEEIPNGSDSAQSRSDWTGGIGGLKTARAAQANLNEIPWGLHVSVESGKAEAADVRAEIARRVAAFGGEVIPDTIPRVTRAKPFRAIKALVTPLGERWLSSHGLVEAHKAVPLLKALQSVLEASRDECKACSVRSGFLVSLIGRRITIEPQLYWPDALSDYLLAKVQPDQAARFGRAAENRSGRSLAYRLREQLIAVMDAAGAGHFQIGRTYAGCPGVPDGAIVSWRALKREFDPDRIMNPGVLGL